MKSLLQATQLLIIFSCLSCKQNNYKYPQDRTIADEHGVLKDSLGFYFSIYEPFDSSQNKVVGDTSWQQSLSATLAAFGEPVLFNDYLGKEQYRFLWARSFDVPMVLTIAKANGEITLTTKKLNVYPLPMYVYIDSADWSAEYVERGYQLMRKTFTYSDGETEELTVAKKPRAEITYESTKTLTKEDWQHFTKLLADAEFWNLKAYYWAGYADGDLWLIEANTKKGYKFLIRQSPSGKIRKIGKLLIKLSGLKERM
jgi:hypothetical protein